MTFSKLFERSDETNSIVGCFLIILSEMEAGGDRVESAECFRCFKVLFVYYRVFVFLKALEVFYYFVYTLIIKVEADGSSGTRIRSHLWSTKQFTPFPE